MNIFPRNTTVCFISAHPDDIELGCGALISRIHKRCKVVCIVLTKNQADPRLKNLLKEHENSLRTLGVSKENIILGNFLARNFFKDRQKICDYLVGIEKIYNPEIIFTHSFSDVHQDHEVVAKEVLRIFKQKTIIGFEISASSYQFSPDFYFEVTRRDLGNKIKSLSCYKTYKKKIYFAKELIKAQLIRNGLVIGREYAESYDIIRLSCSLYRKK